MKRTRARTIRIALALMMALMMIPTAAQAGRNDHNRRGDHRESSLNHQLAQVRRSTARFHRLSNAQAAGYQLGYRGLVTGCIQNPGVGAMGYHYFNWELFDDLSETATAPEGMVYAPDANGALHLAAVEWVVPGVEWAAAGNTEPPEVMGMPMHVLNPALGWYILHAWVWMYNPAGMFEDWNPLVTCP
jgi:hypothetical protein